MAISAKKLHTSFAVKVVTHTGEGRNWTVELWELTGDGTSTSVTVNTSLLTPIFATAVGKDVSFEGYIDPSATGGVTVTFTSAPGSGKKFLLKIEGWA